MLVDIVSTLGMILTVAGGLATLVWGFGAFYTFRKRHLESERQSLLTAARRQQSLFRTVPKLLQSSEVVRDSVVSHNKAVEFVIAPYQRLLVAAHNWSRRAAGMQDALLTWPHARLSEDLINLSFDQIKEMIQEEERELDLGYAKRKVMKIGIVMIIAGAVIQQMCIYFT